jgi:hypothetical protein
MSIFGNVAELSAERMEELAGQANPRDAGIAAVIATDKFQPLSGDATAHLAVNIERFDIGAELNKLLDEAREKYATAKKEQASIAHQQLALPPAATISDPGC